MWDMSSMHLLRRRLRRVCGTCRSPSPRRCSTTPISRRSRARRSSSPGRTTASPLRRHLRQKSSRHRQARSRRRWGQRSRRRHRPRRRLRWPSPSPRRRSGTRRPSRLPIGPPRRPPHGLRPDRELARFRHRGRAVRLDRASHAAASSGPRRTNRAAQCAPAWVAPSRAPGRRRAAPRGPPARRGRPLRGRKLRAGRSSNCCYRLWSSTPCSPQMPRTPRNLKSERSGANASPAGWRLP
mmetsp:Transcript_3549/g.10356  ORF Transcript_3549/g.10356 Transcript_3549/m.10356 type:complete len:239 (-) Transcript_3549:143-859(-)